MLIWRPGDAEQGSYEMILTLTQFKLLACSIVKKKNNNKAITIRMIINKYRINWDARDLTQDAILKTTSFEKDFQSLSSFFRKLFQILGPRQNLNI